MDRYILKKSEIEDLSGIDKTHFLNENAKRNNKSLGDLLGIAGFGFHIIEVPPNSESTEYHQHKFEDECVYILSGEAEVTIGVETYNVAPGDFIGYRANGLPHTMKNTGESPLQCIVVGTRLVHEVVDYPRQGKRLFCNHGQPWDLVDVSNITNPNAGKKA